MTDADRRRNDLIRCVTDHFLALTSSQKADLILEIPALYFAVARLARSEEITR